MEAIRILAQKRLVLGVCGSIACYKAVDLASKLTQYGALVDVILTDAARQFVTPLTFQAVTGRPVYSDLWQGGQGGGDVDAHGAHIAHVGLGEHADALLIVPATANTLAKLAHGLADDLLSVTALAARGPLLVAPAMDGGMYQHAATQSNVATLTARGTYVVQPEVGRFASGLVGQGRLPETHTLIGHIRALLGRGGALRGRSIVITAGGTREALDPVRFITNRSSGKQGHALAHAAADAGAQVVLITSAALDAPPTAQVIRVDSARAMQAAVLEHSRTADALIMAAAVADFRPHTVSEHKIKKKDDSDDGLTLQLTRNPDILLSVKEQRADGFGPRVVVGFAAESEDVLANGLRKLQRKGLDLLIANDISATDAGFEVDTNRVLVLDAHGGQQTIDLSSKAHIAEVILARVIALF
jgi:phosphopantothenoylcysteine decarboxylase / phosphopantothenate---cysteine ligase